MKQSPNPKRSYGGNLLVVADYEQIVTEWMSSTLGTRTRAIHSGNPLLARGAFGELSIAIDTELPWSFAVIKTISQATVSDGWKSAERRLSKEVFNEILALRLLNPHENIVSFLGLHSSAESMAGSVSLVFRYSPMDLQLLIDTRRSNFSWPVIKTMAKDIIAALEHCHAHGILHRDMTPRNLLLSQLGRVQLCDFGLCKPCPSLATTRDDSSRGSPLPNLEPKKTGTKGLCTLYYRPPEVLLGGPAHHWSVDMYSAGLVIIELVLLRPLFVGQNDIDQLGLIFSILGTPSDKHWSDARLLPDYGKLNFPFQKPRPLHLVAPRLLECRLVEQFVEQCIALDPLKRLSASAALRHELWNVAPIPASYSTIMETSIPEELRGPRLLFSSAGEKQNALQVAQQEAMKVAAARRSYAEIKRTDVASTSLFNALQTLER
jgi:serine/threonine protein kinase